MHTFLRKEETKTMRLAIFSDIHGKILLPFKLADWYQQQTGLTIDFILQCGDMGAYPSLENLDKATLKHAQYDRDELGFYDDFVTVNPRIKAYLEELDLEMICVRGNHEDHVFLDDLEEKYADQDRSPIDVYQKVWVCKSGKVQSLETEDDSCSFVGIGRIGDRRGRDNPRFIQDYERKEIRKLLRTKEDFDILLTHDKDASSQRGFGMKEIRTVLDNIIFQYHFYGHTGEPFHMVTDNNGITQSCKIKELEFTEDGILPEGCFIIMQRESGEEDWEIEVVSTKLTNQLAKHNWKY